ncbi:MAG TPA: ABC transporter ATP-binding protein [Candidatus Dormibacteraeota bacterium]|jgi:NitT/TauT family transport system ATP-binding protein|nr:ABC transporter ATP-binding protein [Candidatus Dormibacteraeota bacterium]
MAELIRVEGAAKRFANGVEVFVHLDLTVIEGECLCIVGPSGCGKTTLLRAIDGVLPLDAGRITIGGEEVRGPRRDVAMVFQGFGLFPWKTVEQNIAYGLEMAGAPRSLIRERVARQVELVGLRGFERALPYQLSGGMRQRVGLARALAVEPDVLLMDEPFGSLDALTREVLQDELLRIWQVRPVTTVFITHSIEEAIALGDRVVVLGPRPARVRTVLEVGIPRPRSVASVIAHPSFVQLRDRCWSVLRDLEAA